MAQDLIQRVVWNDPGAAPGFQRFLDQVRERLNGLTRSGGLVREDGGFSVAVSLASPSGLEFSSGELRIDLDTTILTITAPGLGFATQTKNLLFAGPASGSAAVPTFRGVAAADLGSGSADSTTFLAGDLVWRAAGGATNFIFNEVPSGTVNGSNVTFTLANTPTVGTVRVHLNGLRQTLTTDYSISTDTITFVTAPLTGDVLVADYHK